ncbi:cytochrome C biogenesis protein [Neisseria zalophi]|nr:cytochrome C biogenesis protein [Neisseria zalophi]
MKKLFWFIKKHGFNILLWWVGLSIIMSFYASNNIRFNLIVIPIISFFIVLLYHLELERKNISMISVIQIILGMFLGLASQIERSNTFIIKGLLIGALLGLATPVWVRLFLVIRKKIGNYI